jgi:hypothetical protein
VLKQLTIAGCVALTVNSITVSSAYSEPVQPPPPPSSIPIPCANYNGYNFTLQQDLKTGQNSTCASLTKLIGEVEIGGSYKLDGSYGVGIGFPLFGINTGVGYIKNPNSSAINLQISGQWR